MSSHTSFQEPIPALRLLSLGAGAQSRTHGTRHRTQHQVTTQNVLYRDHTIPEPRPTIRAHTFCPPED